MLFAAILLASIACEGSDWDRHALTGPEASRLIADVEIKPTHAVIHPDGEKQFSAVVRSGRGTVVSRNVTWRSLDEDVLLVDPSGTVIGMNEGTATLEATHQGVKGQVTVDVYGEVVAIRLNRNSLTLDEGHTAQLEAVYVYANGAERPAGPLEWRSDDPTILRVDSDGLARGIRGGVTMIRVRGRGHKLGVESRVQASAVASIEVIAPTTSLGVGDEVQFWAEIRDAQGNRLFRPLEWSSSNGSVASVSAAGMVQGRASGQARILASVDGVMGEVEIAVGSSSSSGGQTEARPSAVTNLSVASTETNAARLQFREVDDGTGQSAEYEVRYAEAPLGQGWGSAERVAKGTCQAPVRGTGIGNTRSCTVEGLQPGTRYDFQLVPFRGTMNQDAVYGPLSNIASGTTKEAPIKVEVRPSSASLEVEETLRLRATVTDHYGNTLNRTVSWSSTRPSVASITASGNEATMTALAPGDTEGRASADGVHGGSQVRVIRPHTGLTTNQPSGFTRISERAFTMRDELGWVDRNLEIANDGSAPFSPSTVGQLRYPAGFTGGVSPGRAMAPRFSYGSVYASFWFKVSSNWQGHPASGVNKMIFITDESEGGGGDPAFLALYGHGSNPLHFQVRVQGPNVQGRAIGSNLASAQIARGVWHHIEVLLVINTSGRSNGEAHVWIDGRKTHEYRDVQYVSSGSNSKFDNWRWEPTWGGVGETVRSEMFQYMDHVYLSGK